MPPFKNRSDYKHESRKILERGVFPCIFSRRQSMQLSVCTGTCFKCHPSSLKTLETARTRRSLTFLLCSCIWVKTTLWDLVTGFVEGRKEVLSLLILLIPRSRPGRREINELVDSAGWCLLLLVCFWEMINHRRLWYWCKILFQPVWFMFSEWSNYACAPVRDISSLFTRASVARPLSMCIF